MSGWITITIDDLHDRMSGVEVARLREVARAAGQDDPLPGVIHEVVQEVRGYVAAWDNNLLNVGDTIPQKLKGAAMSILRYRLATRLPGMGNLLDEPRQREYTEANRLLSRVAEGKFEVDKPQEPVYTEVVGGPGVQVVNSRERVADKEGLSGL